MNVIVIGAVLVLIGFIGAIWSSTELTNGLVEVPSHWWSALATAPALVGLVLVGLGLRRTRS